MTLARETWAFVSTTYREGLAVAELRDACEPPKELLHDDGAIFVEKVRPDRPQQRLARRVVPIACAVEGGGHSPIAGRGQR
jgi:hypothetical protein